jgi:hypothetical protein
MHIAVAAFRAMIRCFYWPFCSISGILDSFPQLPETDVERHQIRQQWPAFELA